MAKDVRTYNIYKEVGVYKIKWEGGGELSPYLRGSYTSPKEAEYAISVYEAARPQKIRQAKRGVKNVTEVEATDE